MNEIWKPVPEFEGIYEVSSLGRVKSLKFGKDKILKPGIVAKNYYQVTLCKSNIIKYYKIHQLVAIVFLNHKPCGMKLVIDHINDNSFDNRVENLQLVTQRNNSHKTQGKYTSKYKGVYWNKNNNKWHSRIIINGKLKHLGYHNCELKAHHTYLQAVKELEQKKGRN